MRFLKYKHFQDREPDKPKKTINPQKFERRRELNVIYFVDSNKTKAFKMTLSKFYMLTTLASAVVIWALVAGVILVKNMNKYYALETKAKATLAALFEYQTRFDKVYEKAYPDGLYGQDSLAGNSEDGFLQKQGQKTPERLAEVTHDDNKQPTSKTQTPDKPIDNKPVNTSENEVSQEVAVSETTTTAENIQPSIKAETVTNQTAAVPTDIASKDANPAPPAQASNETVATNTPNPDENIAAAKIEGPRFEMKKNSLVLKFAIHNDHPNEKAEGNLWGVAQFVTDHDESIYLGAPNSIAVDHNGEATQPHRSYRYNIRKYKAKNLEFDAPYGKAGVFKQVKLVISNKKGIKEVYDFPLKETFKVSAPVAAPETQPSSEPANVPQQINPTPTQQNNSEPKKEQSNATENDNNPQQNTNKEA